MDFPYAVEPSKNLFGSLVRPTITVELVDTKEVSLEKTDTIPVKQVGTHLHKTLGNFVEAVHNYVTAPYKVSKPYKI